MIPTSHKLFFALRPDAVSAERIAREVTEAHMARGLTARLRPSRIFHITLHYFGAFPSAPPQPLIELACRAAQELVWPPLETDFEGFASWGGEGARSHPFVLTGGQSLQPVRALRDALGERLAAHGIPSRPDYEPHLTLRYDRRPAVVWAQRIRGWLANEFVLVDSPQGLTRHDVLARWPLRG